MSFLFRVMEKYEADLKKGGILEAVGNWSGGGFCDREIWVKVVDGLD